MLQNSPIRTHEDFSLTGNLLEITSEWQKKSNLGSFGARVVNLTCTPFTALIDAVAHLALGTFTICGGSLIGGSIWNFGIHLAGRNRWSVLRFEGGLINLNNALQHAIGIVVIPIIGCISPEIAAKKFQGCQSAKIEFLEQQNRKLNKLEKNNVAQKILVENLQGKKKLLKKYLNIKNQQINNLVNATIENKQTISTLKLDLNSRDVQIKEQNLTISSQQEFIIKLMAEIELKNQQLEEAEMQDLPNDDEFEEEIKLLKENHAREIKVLTESNAREIESKNLSINELTNIKITRGKTISDLQTRLSRIPKVIKQQYSKDVNQDENESPVVKEPIKPARAVLSYIPIFGSFF